MSLPQRYVTNPNFGCPIERPNEETHEFGSAAVRGFADGNAIEAALAVAAKSQSRRWTSLSYNWIDVEIDSGCRFEDTFLDRIEVMFVPCVAERHQLSTKKGLREKNVVLSPSETHYTEVSFPAHPSSASRPQYSHLLTQFSKSRAAVCLFCLS